MSKSIKKTITKVTPSSKQIENFGTTSSQKQVKTKRKHR